MLPLISIGNWQSAIGNPQIEIYLPPRYNIPMSQTRTGSFPIGFRRGWSDWQKNLPSLISFAKSNGFQCLDVGDLPADQIKPILAAGLGVGSVDLKQPWSALASADAGKRKNAVAIAAEHVQSVAALGIRNFFTVVFPETDSRDRRESFRFAVDGYAMLAQAIAPSGARIVIEGYPGGYPYFPAFCCTPESLRIFFKETAADSLAINFDPSHLIRMGIDPVRFLGEFANRIGHVHAKDAEIMPERLYDFGNLQPATQADPIPFGGHSWRYCIPGHGQAPWVKMLATLKGAGYRGFLSIELEDANFNGTEAGEQRGLLASRDFLVNV
jgi:sugar phosphate isomerase/epimerase